MRILRFLSPLLIVAFLLTNLANSAGQAIGSADTPPFTLDRRIQPLLTSIEPTAGGTLVTVSGDKFFSQHTWVKIGEVEVKKVTVISSNQLTFKMPKWVAGEVDIQVINSGGLAASLSQAYRYEAPLAKKVEVTATETSLVANGQATTKLTIKLFDQHGGAMADETVNLLADKGKLAEKADNNNDGTYSATYTAASSPGEVTIQAITSTSGQLGTLKLDLTPRQVSAEKSKVSAEEGWFTIGQSGAEVTVTLVYQDGYPLAGKKVEVKVEPEAESQLGEIMASDGEGITRFKLQASSRGSRVVTISVGEVVLSQQAMVKFTSNQVTEAIINSGSIQQVGQLVEVEITLRNEDQPDQWPND